MSRKIPESTVRRLSHYLRSLEGFPESGGTVSSEELASRGQTTAAQVRKDLSHFGSFGKRGLGYQVDERRARLRSILGIDRTWRVALVGAGRIGLALFEYPAFRARGYDCVAIFDAGGVLQYRNELCSAIFGAADIRGKRCGDLFHPGQRRAPASCPVEGALAGERRQMAFAVPLGRDTRYVETTAWTCPTPIRSKWQRT